MSNWIKNYIASMYHNWSETYVQRGQADLAINASTKALKLNPESVACYVDRGMAYMQKGDYALAIADFDHALTLSAITRQEKADLYARRGLAHFYSGDANAAISDYNLAIFMVKSLSMAYVYRGIAEMSLDNHPAAMTDFNQAIHHDADNFIAYRRRGDCHVKLGNIRAAIKDYWRYVEIGTLNAKQRDEIRVTINQLEAQLQTA